MKYVVLLYALYVCGTQKLILLKIHEIKIKIILFSKRLNYFPLSLTTNDTLTYGKSKYEIINVDITRGTVKNKGYILRLCIYIILIANMYRYMYCLRYFKL